MCKNQFVSFLGFLFPEKKENMRSFLMLELENFIFQNTRNFFGVKIAQGSP